MTAGLVAYKLCDRDFDCEHCPFDAVRRGYRLHDVYKPAALQPDAEELEFPDDRRYHPAHTWAQIVDGEHLRVGIDAFAAGLIGCAATVILPPRGATVHRGRIGCWLLDDSGPIPLKMPVSGKVRRNNARLRRYPCLAAESPYDEGWLLKIVTDDPGRELATLLPAAEMRRRMQTELLRLRKQAAAHVGRGKEAVGVTLADGGERLAALRDMLGPNRYRRLVMQFLN
jgi:glycine cleavage system H protein